MSADTLEDTMAFRTLKALQSVPDPLQEVREFAAFADSKFEKVGSFAPAIEPKDNIHDYAARAGEKAAAWGPEDRKFIDRRKLYGPALAEFVRQDFEILEAESERPHYSLRPGELREVIKTDAGGREIKEFYSDEATGTKPWLDQFKDQTIRYVSGGSAGIATPDNQPSNTYHFHKHEYLPELIELQKQAAYLDSAEFKVIEAYAMAGKVAPEEVLAKVRGK
jgi:hypothetical protein